MKHHTLIRMGTLAALFCLGTMLAAQAAALSNALGARAIAVFPLAAPEGSLRPEHAFARFAVPDMLRQGLVENGGYLSPDAAAVNLALAEHPVAAGDPDRTDGAAAWLPAARALGADHFIWGYLVSTGEGLGVFVFLVDTSSGETVHRDWRTLAGGQTIFDEAADFARGFSDWIHDAVPLRPEVIYVDRPTLVPAKPLEEPQKPLPRNSVSAGAEFRFFLPPFSNWLQPAVRPVVDLSLGLADPTVFALGLSLSAGPLSQKGSGLFGAAEGSSISVVQASLLLDGTLHLRLANTLLAQASVEAGVAVIAGAVSGRFISYVRPEAGLVLGLEWRPLAWFALAAAAHAALVPWAWEDNIMVDISPRIVLRFLF